MVKRKCPKCGISQFSSVEQEDWVCIVCGATVSKELNEPITKKNKTR